ncbi:MAG TPA: flagellar assembly protein FliW [Solirubrobacteraceae bacterium]|jgi:flagellar assembly factor FliW|nr:flagellar assembly protein FliW [Solirubrobacteraceae bacterium]
MNATSVFTRGAAADHAHEAPTETYETSRFGSVDVIVDSIIDFPDGLIGLGGSRYALLSTDAKSPFLWLQSLDNAAVALPVANPHRFFRDFEVELTDSDAGVLGFDDGRPADVYVTVTASSVASEITVNLKAPILIRDGNGHQVINQSAKAAVKTPLFPVLPPGATTAAAA